MFELVVAVGATEGADEALVHNAPAQYKLVSRVARKS